VCVWNPDGSARLCVDYKRVNAITEQQPFYMPRVEEVLEGIGRASYISKLDLMKGYYQIPMAKVDIHKTAFVCQRGRFEFLRMPFEIKNAPAVFQELMQNLLRDDAQYTTPYMDDVVVFSNSWGEHIQHIDQGLEKLKSAGLTANPDKCKWGGRTVEFQGHQVGNGRMSLPSHRAEALADYTKPTTRGLRAFLGAIGFYRCYVRQFANHTAMLTPLIFKSASSKVVTLEGEFAFNF